MQILSSRIIEQTLLGVKLSQPKHAVQRGLELGKLFVHRDGFNGETLGAIGVANAFETVNRLVDLAQTSVEIAHGVRNCEVLGISFEDLFVLSDGVRQFALLDEFFRNTENLLFIETKTKRHMSADSGSGSPPTLERFLRKGSKDGIDLLRSEKTTRSWSSDKGYCKARCSKPYGY